MSFSLPRLAPFVFALTGCSLSVQPVVAPAPSPTEAKASHGSLGPSPKDVRALRVAYEIRRTDPAHTLVLSGQSEIDLAHSALIERGGPRDGSSLKVRTDRTAEGSLLVDLDYAEHSSEGEHLRWSPVMSLAEGSTALAKLDLGGGDGRVAVVKVVPIDEVAAKPASAVASRAP